MASAPARLLVGLAAVFALQAAAYAELELSGYGQLRYYRWDSDLRTNREFDVRRLYLQGSGPIGNSGTTLSVEVNFAKLDTPEGKLTLSAATLDQVLGPGWQARVGRFDAWFGWETDYSSRRRLPLERSRSSGGFLPGDTILGVGLRRCSPGIGRPEFSVLFTRGMRDWEETDARSRAVILRARLPFGDGRTAGVSYMGSRRTLLGGERFRDDCYNLHLRCQATSTLTFQGEYYLGDILGASGRGWYGMLECQPHDSRTAFFYRFEAFDLGASNLDGHTLGCAYDLDPLRRITAQIETLTEDGREITNFGLQYQFRYNKLLGQ